MGTYVLHEQTFPCKPSFNPPRVPGHTEAVKHARKELWFEVPERRAYLNITPQVQEFVGESGIANGLCLVNPMHITAAAT